MKLNSVSMRKWILHNAFICGVINVFYRDAAYFFTAFSLWTGLLLKDLSAHGYTRKTGPLREGARAFLLLSAMLFMQSILNICISLVGMNDHLLCFFSVPLITYCTVDIRLTMRFSIKLCILLGVLLSCMFLLVAI